MVKRISLEEAIIQAQERQNKPRKPYFQNLTEEESKMVVSVLTHYADLHTNHDKEVNAIIEKLGGRYF